MSLHIYYSLLDCPVCIFFFHLLMSDSMMDLFAMVMAVKKNEFCTYAAYINIIYCRGPFYGYRLSNSSSVGWRWRLELVAAAMIIGLPAGQRHSLRKVKAVADYDGSWERIIVFNPSWRIFYIFIIISRKDFINFNFSGIFHCLWFFLFISTVLFFII